MKIRMENISQRLHTRQSCQPRASDVDPLLNALRRPFSLTYTCFACSRPPCPIPGHRLPGPACASAEPPPSGLGRGGPADAPLVAAAGLEPLLGAEGEVAVELLAGVLAVDEVAEAATDAAFARVEAAAG